jgi:hypothetical protein
MTVFVVSSVTGICSLTSIGVFCRIPEVLLFKSLLLFIILRDVDAFDLERSPRRHRYQL